MPVRYLKSGKTKFPVDITHITDSTLSFQFAWSQKSDWVGLKNEIKGLENARFDFDKKIWTAANTPRNTWVLDYLDVNQPNPYDKYRQKLPSLSGTRALFDHQNIMLSHCLFRRQCIMAAEMGTGKTLVIIEALEHLKPKNAWYVAPKFALHAISLEFNKWNAQVWPLFLTYDQMKKEVVNWPSGELAPDFICFDESAYVKNSESQRSKRAQELVDGMRTDHADPTIILMSGAPAPKSPVDWWKQCEIACPGYLREKQAQYLKYRLSLIKKEESMSGGTYPQHVTWWDDETKCKVCGQPEDYHDHIRGEAYCYHQYEPSKNEIRGLYKRMAGLVQVIFKKDCLDLPDKVYRIVRIKPTQKAIRYYNMIKANAKTTIEALTRWRELSDGFLYKEQETDTEIICERCQGTGIVNSYEPGEVEAILGRGLSPEDTTFSEIDMTCPKCLGKGLVFKVIRISEAVKRNPKIEALKELLDENEEQGRIVVYAGFTASIDIICDACIKYGWEVIRVDGEAEKIGKDGAWTSCSMGNPLVEFQDKARKIPKIAFVAHPASAKTALTLTEAWMLVYYSNTFIGDDRMQSEERIHRIGMDLNKGATIVDLFHLPSDLYVHDNIKGKRKLQGMSLGQVLADLAKYDEEER